MYKIYTFTTHKGGGVIFIPNTSKYHEVVQEVFIPEFHRPCSSEFKFNHDVETLDYIGNTDSINTDKLDSARDGLFYFKGGDCC